MPKWMPEMTISASGFSASTRLAPFRAAMAQSVAGLPSPQVGINDRKGRTSFRRSTPTTRGSWRYRPAMKPRPRSQSSSGYCAVYHRPSPSLLLQHQPAAEMCWLRTTSSPAPVRPATVASKSSNGDSGWSSGFARSVTLARGTRVRFRKASSKLKGSRTQLNPRRTMVLAMAGSGWASKPFMTICPCCAPYQFTHASCTRRPCRSTTWRPCVRRGSAEGSTRAPAAASAGAAERAAAAVRARAI
mmetsp:Transcript_108516/g.338241  ORF Transcript_108516/g.338241 Transcript_108516/m.338241 type:complete len:245 (-) Transcript_108516:13-747(-)